MRPGLLASLLFFLACQPNPHAAARPNVLVVIADQWRAQAFGFAGDPNARTPNFDRLAAQSARFVNAVSGMPVCSPMRASFLTGQRPLTHGVFLNDVPLNTNAITLAKVFAGAGYDTGMIGKWHVDGHGRSSYIPPERRQGFDYWKVLECTHQYTNSAYYAQTPERLKWPDYDAFSQTQDAQQFLRARAATSKPFALVMAWGPPHDPYFSAPPKYRAMFDPAKIQLRPNVPPAFHEIARKNLAGYYAHCAALDDSIGALLETLRETGLDQNTIVLFTSDHGDMLGSHGMAKKQKPFDESVRVPLLVRCPPRLGVKPASLRAPINTEDLMPTLLGLCGIPIPPSVEGLDFSAHLRGSPPPGDGAALILCVTPFGEWERRVGGREYRGIRTERHTFTRDLSGPWLLFDNELDPHQMTNLVCVAAHAGLQQSLDSALARSLAARKDEFRPGPDYIRQWGYRVDPNGTVPYRN